MSRRRRGRSTRAVAAADDDYGALATTRRQLRTICDVTGADPEILSTLSGPAVVHYCGHRIAATGEEGRFSAETEAEAARLVAAEVDRHPAGYAYGSLASGGDILWAEALLARGCELHVILPFDLDEFVHHSVAPSGCWLDRALPSVHRRGEGRQIRDRTTPSSTTTSSTATGPSWRWAWRCFEPDTSMRTCASSRSGTEVRPAVRRAQRSTWRRGDGVGGRFRSSRLRRPRRRHPRARQPRPRRGRAGAGRAGDDLRRRQGLLEAHR